MSAEEIPPLTESRIEVLIQTACKEGRFEEDFYFEKWPHVTAKIFADRKRLLEAAELAHSRMVPHTPNAILLAAAIESAHAGMPVEVPDES